MSRNHFKINKGLSLGPVATQPSDPENGDLIYNNTTSQFEKYEGGVWKTLGSSGSSPVVDLFTGDGIATTFTLSVDPGSETNTMVFISGVYQNKDTYSLSGTTLTFDTAPPDTTSIQVVSGEASVINVPANLSVSTAKIQDNAVTTPKIANGSITSSKMGAANMASSVVVNFSTTSTSAVDVTSLSVPITTNGRPVHLSLVGGSISGNTSAGSGSQILVTLVVLRDATNISNQQLKASFNAASTAWEILIPASSINTVDVVSAGTYTYKIQVNVSTSNVTATFTNAKLIAYEI